MRDDWKEPAPAKIAPSEPKAEPPQGKAADEFELLLAEYEGRKQKEAARTVQRALEIEQTRRSGVDALRRHVIARARDTVRRLQQAGHRVVYQELMEAYPPSLRLHLYPKAGPIDLDQPSRRTLELIWGEPEPDRLCARRWTSTGLGDMVDCGSVAAAELDELWVREQLLSFVRSTLELS